MRNSPKWSRAIKSLWYVYKQFKNVWVCYIYLCLALFIVYLYAYNIAQNIVIVRHCNTAVSGSVVV